MRIVRREKPGPMRNYRLFKPYLRRDFYYTCAYCLCHEANIGGLINFAVEHYKPKRKFEHLALVYSNLYYACNWCNSYKGETWPAPRDIRAGRRFVDPCAEEPLQHLRFDRAGGVRGTTPAGLYTIKHCRLERPALTKYRRRLADSVSRCLDRLVFLDDIAQRIFNRKSVQPDDRRELERQIQSARADLRLMLYPPAPAS